MQHCQMGEEMEKVAHIFSWMEPKIAGCLNGRYENSLQLIVEIHRQTVSVPERKSCPPSTHNTPHWRDLKQ